MTQHHPEPADRAATARLDAVCDLIVPDARESAGLHRYDGLSQDLSSDGVTRALERLGHGPAPEDAHDAAHLEVFESGLRWTYEELEAHRRNPLLHLSNLELACYDREYAPAEQRAAAKLAHLRTWPEAVDTAVRTLDEVAAPVARALLPSVRGMAVDLGEGLGRDAEPAVEAALSAHGRLVAHIEGLAESGDPDCAVGAEVLAREMGAWEGMPVDLEQLAGQARTERDRLRELLQEACSRLDPHTGPLALVDRLRRDHPDSEGILAEARAVTEEVLAFTREHGLVPWTDGECRVGIAPPSRRWGMAAMSWAAPEEDDAPSWFHVTPPEPDWPAEDVEDWLEVFSRTTLPAITVHEVAPGHYTHARALRRAPSAVRRRLIGVTFAEGWAHYAEEMVIEAGFRENDPRYRIGTCLEGLVRVVRLACSIGLHTGELSLDEAIARFREDAYLGEAAARSEALRGTFDIGYGRYTWGRLVILELRERARALWGPDFSLSRFHAALLALGSPPLGLLDHALTIG